ncbi:vitellogenin-2-like [Cydia amplana]|uniref:vitellogenin-2-like n=1 Tax=Cydia amplana TaxID=1869771 RepID=UPI002FE5F085
MTGSSSWSENAPGADILDLDRYMRGTRPARRPQRNINSSGLVVDAGAAGRRASPSSSASSASSASGPSGPSDKRFSHDSGLSDTSYRRASRQQRRHTADTVSKNDAAATRRSNRSGSEATRQGNSGEARRSNSEARRGKSREARRGKSGSEAHRTSEIKGSLRESLERALRDQQARFFLYIFYSTECTRNRLR